MTEPGTAIVIADTTESGRYCGARTRAGAKHPYCRQRAGHGTKHVGDGRCKLHGGATPITSGRGSRSESRFSRINRPRLRELYEHFESDADPLNILPELAAARALFVDFIERYDEWREAFLAWHFDYAAKYAPISEEKRLAFVRAIEEYEILLQEGRTEPSAKQLENLRLARDYVDRVADPILLTNPKPREVLDVSAAIGHVDAVTKIVERIEKIRAANAISRVDFLRLTAQMGLAMEKRVRETVPDEAQATRVLRTIRTDWLSLALAATAA